MTFASRRRAARIILLLAVGAPSARAQAAPPDRSAPPIPSREVSRETSSESAGSVARRVVAEAMMGVGLATVGYVAAPEIITGSSSDSVRAAEWAGASAAFPLGVAWGGHLVHGHGWLSVTVAAPWLVSALTGVALYRDENGDGRPALQIATWGSAIAAPLSIVSYELSNAASRAGASRSQVQVSVSPWRDGARIAVGWQH